MVQEYQEKLKESIEKSEAAVRKTGEWVKGIIKHRQKNIDNNNATDSTNGTAQKLKSASTVIGAHSTGFFIQDPKNTDENLSVIDGGIKKAERELAEVSNTLGNEQGLTRTMGFATAATTGEG